MNMSKWTKALLDDVCQLITDGSHFSPPSVECGFPMVSVKDFSGYGFDFTNCRQISQDDYNTLVKNGCMPEIDDILIGKDGARYFEDVIIFKQKEKPVLLSSIAIIRADTTIVIPKFLYYYLFNKELRQQVKDNLGSGSAIPRMVLKDFKRIPTAYPDIKVQRAIAATLSCLDDKIELNNRIIANLEAQAHAIFKSWFVDFEPWDGVPPNNWQREILGNCVDIKRGGSPRPIQEYLTTAGLRWLKISDVTSINTPFVYEIKQRIRKEGLKKTIYLNAGSLVLSNSATPGIPKILGVDSCIHDGWLYFSKSIFSREFLYLFFKHIRNNLVSLGNGSVFTNLKTDILKNYPILKPSEKVLSTFDANVKPCFGLIDKLTIENATLENLRDTLLPKLMSGEIEVPVEE